MITAAILCKDIFSLVKIQATLDHLNMSHVKLSGPADPHIAGARFILVDLTDKDAFAVIAQAPEKSIGFGPHMQADLFEKAKVAGCTRAYPRSRFFQELRALIVHALS